MLFLWISSVLLSAQARSEASQVVNAEGRKNIERIVRTLPNTAFRNWLEHGPPGSGVHQRYMDLMTKLYVRRALLKFQGVWQNDRLKDPRIVSHMYFSQYDGRNARITNGARLQAIEADGLQDTLDQVALEKARGAHPFCIESCQSMDAKSVTGFVELYDNAWIPAVSPTIGEERISPLESAALLGDWVRVDQLLRGAKYSQDDLNKALWAAVGQYRDNTEVMELLVHAGGDVNSRLEDKNGTLLMFAVHNPVHLTFLLNAGANVNDQDQYGRTALGLAEKAGEEDAAWLLRQSGGH